jgi:hypothetical protein
MTNDRKEEASKNRKRRKEQLDQKRRGKNSVIPEESTKTNSRVARQKRKKLNEQKKEAKHAKKTMITKFKRKTTKKNPVTFQQIQIVRYGISESQHSDANTVMLCYGIKKD